jgi:hypothetical protein
MGFTINESININETDIYLNNCYVTIKGELRIERQKNYNSLDDDNFTYVLVSYGEIYKDISQYTQRKNPLVVNIFSYHTLTDLNVNLHLTAYNALKDKIKKLYNNEALTFVDHL